MAQNVGYNPAIQQFKNSQVGLESQGVDIRQIDEWIQSKGLDSILADNKLLLQYFTSATKGLAAITDWDYINRPARPAEVTPPSLYQAYYQDDTSRGAPYVDYFPAKQLFNPQWLIENQYMSPQQGQALQWVMDNGLLGNQGGVKVGALSTGGAGKALSTGGTVKASQLPEPPTPPEGMPAFGENPTTFSGNTGFDPNFGGATYATGERDFVNSIGGYEMGVLNIIMDNQDFSRGVAAQIVMNSQGLEDTRRRLVGLMENLDPTDPQQAHQIMVIQQELQMVNSTMRENQDKLLRVQHFDNERIDFAKSLLDIFQRTDDALIRNMRVGS
jgi:hypothetical protein